MRGEFVFKRFINNCCNAEYITERRRSSLMGDDAYWRCLMAEITTER